jgi:hypothetical protein
MGDEVVEGYLGWCHLAGSSCSHYQSSGNRFRRECLGSSLSGAESGLIRRTAYRNVRPGRTTLRASGQSQAVSGKPGVRFHQQCIDCGPAGKSCKNAEPDGVPHFPEHLHAGNHRSIGPAGMNHSLQITLVQPVFCGRKGRSGKINESKMRFSIEKFHQVDLPTTYRTFTIKIYCQRIGLRGRGRGISLLVERRSCLVQSRE